MKEINFNLGNEIRIHNLGLAKLEAEQRPIPINVVELSKRISELCKKSEASYWEMQEALVLADNRLYHELTSQKNWNHLDHQ
ncbi:MAG: hypothetical protein ABF723_02125 [Lentilactobacillus hilgardii]|uniref:hypothetical protein n=1 Tax=Lactobacillaceae TaxID=33958 RepID=UPI001CC20838|nr:hypothetical protein [Lentilactobacillus hilgardii]MBZ2200548.1 hypothetical protein [Lentilactobacillus hilgardii]MBZ2204576.1 hypothetical protein [Lentilactobacillus hilgardii]